MTPIWVSVSASHVGIHEIPGQQSAAVIQQWAEDLGVSAIYPNDAVAWCALYMNRLMLACQLPTTGKGYDLLRARMFAMWGQPLGGVALGAVLVFTRPEGAHVGIYLGENVTHYYVRGGNQRDSVCDVWLEKRRCVAQRWPMGVALPELTPILLAANGAPVSVNEA